MEFALEIIQKAREFVEGKNGCKIPTIKEFEESLKGRLTLVRI